MFPNLNKKDSIESPLVAINSQEVFNLHIKVYKIFGLWPPKHPNILNRLHVLLAYDINTFGLLTTFLIAIPFIDSIEVIVANLMFLTVLFAVGIKSALVYYKKSKILQVFELITELDGRVTHRDEAAYLNRVIRECKIITKFVFNAYCYCWICLVIWSVFTPREKRIWLSTALFPHEIAEHQWLYWIVLAFQAQSNLLLCFTAAASDTFGVFLCSILSGHLDVLGHKLKFLGNQSITVSSGLNMNKSKTNLIGFKSDLISLIEIHKKCVR